MSKVVETILCYFGFFLLGLLIVALGIILFLTLLGIVIGLRSYMIRFRSKFAIQCMRALLEFILICGTGLFFGASIGTAIQTLLPKISALENGAVIGFLFGSVCAFYIVTTKWGRCYLDKHDYIPIPEYAQGGNDFLGGCRWCGKDSDD
jgi:hypothetical protein